MGGSILFTSSRNFNPALYGLVAGKSINYIIIGGGGAGGSMGILQYYYDASYTTNQVVAYDTGGTNGGTSSIGDYVSAIGGTTGAGRTQATLPSDSSLPYCDGGIGGNGWIPGKIFSSYCLGGAPRGYTTGTSNSLSGSFAIFQDGDTRILRSNYGDGSLTSYSKTINNTSLTLIDGHNTCGYPNPYSSIQVQGKVGEGDDGIGYGAGGGGHQQYDSYPTFGGVGGNAGQFKMGPFELENTNLISITVGSGGTPHTSNTSIINSYSKYGDIVQTSSQWPGRSGTHGAVMLFWD